MAGERFANPEFLWFLLLVPALAGYYWYRRRTYFATVSYSSLDAFSKSSKSLRERLRSAPEALKLGAIALFVIALARPQDISSGENIETEGIDIALVLDISGSMLAEDFTPNRLEAAKQVAAEFIEGRKTDRIGLVIFSAEAFTQCPLTVDYGVLLRQLAEVRNGMVEDGTAIGLAVANGVNRLKDSKAKSKVMILLTDGVNNRGEIDPLTAARIAEAFNIRVYTIGVGAIGSAPYPVQTPFGVRKQLVPVEIDEKTLRAISDMTGGKYYRATDNAKLRSIYREIDRLEKTRIEVTAYTNYTEQYRGWLLAGLTLLAVQFVLTTTYLRKSP